MFRINAKDFERNAIEQNIRYLWILPQTNKKNQLFMNLERKCGREKDLGGEFFFLFYLFLYIGLLLIIIAISIVAVIIAVIIVPYDE